MNERRTELRRGGKAFTLIELLIVVAIIAILAAIAVPNFLEAQVRAKVSRAKSDERAIATAIEAYAVDWNRGPLPNNILNQAGCAAFVFFQGYPGVNINVLAQSKLTTPVAYITTVLDDPFAAKGTYNQNKQTVGHDTPYRFNGFDCDALDAQAQITRRMGYVWVLYSLGPLRNDAVFGVARLLSGHIGGANPTQTVNSYDPSNGTVSMGWILRTNKGVFTVPGS